MSKRKLRAPERVLGHVTEGKTGVQVAIRSRIVWEFLQQRAAYVGEMREVAARAQQEAAVAGLRIVELEADADALHNRIEALRGTWWYRLGLRLLGWRRMGEGLPPGWSVSRVPSIPADLSGAPEVVIVKGASVGLSEQPVPTQ